MSQKILQISAEDAKYIDPKQIVSLTMVDGSTILVRDTQAEEGFVEENQESLEQAATQQVQPQQQQQPLRGLGTNLALGVAAATTAALGAAALGKAISHPRPMVGAPMMGPVMAPRPPMMGPVMAPRPPMMGPVMAPRPPMRGPVMGPRAPMMGPRRF